MFLELEKPLCPLPHHNPWNRLNATYEPDLSLRASSLSGVALGGLAKPSWCISRHRVAIILPFRGREKQLEVLLPNLHKFLRMQLVEYRVFVAEQTAMRPSTKAPS